MFFLLTISEIHFFAILGYLIAFSASLTYCGGDPKNRVISTYPFVWYLVT